MRLSIYAINCVGTVHPCIRAGELIIDNCGVAVGDTIMIPRFEAAWGRNFSDILHKKQKPSLHNLQKW